MRVSHHLAAGLAASVASALVGLVVVPHYLRHLGLEAYGVVAFFTTISALAQVLDLGFGPTLTREVARASSRGAPTGVGPLLHGLAVVTWAAAGLMGGGLALAGPALAAGWLRPQGLAQRELATALGTMGLALACRWPVQLYTAALQGAGRQALAASLSFAATALASLGGVAVLALVSPTLPALFLWQAAVWLGATLVARRAAWSAVGRKAVRAFDPGELRRVWRFSAALTVVSIQAIVLSQLDKILLSRLLPLEEFAGFALASTMSTALYLVVSPFSAVFYPRFSALVAAGDEEGLARAYRIGTRLLGLGTFPLAMVLVFFGGEVVAVWTGDSALASRVAPVVALLAAGSALHAVMHVPYALQLATGRPRLPVVINATLLVVMVPLLVVLVRRSGALGGAQSWLVFHLLYLALGTWLTHRHVLRGQGRSWVLREVGVPLAASAVVGQGGAWLVERGGASGWTSVAAAAGLAVLAGALGLGLSPELRGAARAELAAPAGRA